MGLRDRVYYHDSVLTLDGLGKGSEAFFKVNARNISLEKNFTTDEFYLGVGVHPGVGVDGGIQFKQQMFKFDLNITKGKAIIKFGEEQ